MKAIIRTNKNHRNKRKEMLRKRDKSNKIGHRPMYYENQQFQNVASLKRKI